MKQSYSPSALIFIVNKEYIEINELMKQPDSCCCFMNVSVQIATAFVSKLNNLPVE